MKPIRIAMTAFGPYKDKETIDFTELEDHRLFVVSGNTGAGKTTIFDAICYAVYGQASGDDRSEVRMLRSHFADEDVYTSVEFRFELKGRTYEVFRQLPHVKAGNKSETGERHELYEVVGDQLEPLTDRQSKRPVDERLGQLIGLTREQFSQIVMLPQGEFRKLLVSDTDNKEKILRNIFKTSLYKTVELELDGRRRHVKQELDERIKVQSVFISSIEALVKDRHESKIWEVLQQEYHNVHQVLDGLEDEIELNSEQTRQQQRKLELENQQLKKQTELYHQAKALSERFMDLDERSQQLHELEEKVPLFNRKKLQYDTARQAKNIQVHDDHYNSLVSEINALQMNLETAYKEREMAEQNLEKAEIKYKQEEQNTGEREQLIRELDRLQGFHPTVERMEQTKQMITKLQGEVEASAESLKQTENVWSLGQMEKGSITASIKELEKQVRSYPEKMEKLSSMRVQAKMISDYIKLQDDHKEAAEQELRLRSSFEQAEAAFADIESRWINGQASVLAEHLHDGKPCPVCGSSEHPHKANWSSEVPSKQELEDIRKHKGEVEKSYLAVQSRLDHLKQQLVIDGSQLKQFQLDVERLRDVFADLVEEGKRLSQEVEQLKAEQVKLTELKSKLEELESRLDLLLRQKENVQLQLHQQRASLEKEQALFVQSIHSIPEELRSLEVLTRIFSETEARKQRMDTAWKEAQTSHQKAKERALSARQHVEHIQKQKLDTSSKLEKAKLNLEQVLMSAGFANYEAYQKAKRSDAEIAVLEQEIEEFQRTLALVRKQIEELEIYLKDKPRPMLSVLEVQLRESEQLIDASRMLLVEMQSLTAKLVEAKGNIELAEKMVKESEAQYSQVKDLYDMIRGDNPMKVSFERYLQIEFLEKIIEAANQRLQQMSNGQYVLVRSDRLERHGKQSGLGLDVFDHYTGQYRDVKTLSGGEKFNASLCLALGMADVIQSYEGGISIETMFIDEGFGSLDEESLHKAIETLIDLQQTGRMVGIISHVQELKQAIPAILEVTKSKEGCSHTRFIIS